MKLVVAIIRPERLNAVLEELFRADVQGVTVNRVEGHGGERRQIETARGTTEKMDMSEKVRLEIAVSNHFVDPTVQAILKSARTGSVGDGKIFVLPVEKDLSHPHRGRGSGRGDAGRNDDALIAAARRRHSLR